MIVAARVVCGVGCASSVVGVVWDCRERRWVEAVRHLMQAACLAAVAVWV